MDYTFKAGSAPFYPRHRDVVLAWQCRALGGIPRSTARHKLRVVEDTARVVSCYAYHLPWPTFMRNAVGAPYEWDWVPECPNSGAVGPAKYAVSVEVHRVDLTVSFHLFPRNVLFSRVDHVTHSWVFHVVRHLVMEDEVAVRCFRRSVGILQQRHSATSLSSVAMAVACMSYSGWWLSTEPHAGGLVDPMVIGHERNSTIASVVRSFRRMGRREDGRRIALLATAAMCFAPASILRPWLWHLARRLCAHSVGAPCSECVGRGSAPAASRAILRLFSPRFSGHGPGRAEVRALPARFVRRAVERSSVVRGRLRCCAGEPRCAVLESLDALCVARRGLSSTAFADQGAWPFGVHPRGGVLPPDVPPGGQSLRNMVREAHCGGCKRVSRTMRKCERCLSVHYCSRRCQKKHWVHGHRNVCRARV